MVTGELKVEHYIASHWLFAMGVPDYDQVKWCSLWVTASHSFLYLQTANFFLIYIYINLNVSFSVMLKQILFHVKSCLNLPILFCFLLMFFFFFLQIDTHDSQNDFHTLWQYQRLSSFSLFLSKRPQDSQILFTWLAVQTCLTYSWHTDWQSLLTFTKDYCQPLLKKHEMKWMRWKSTAIETLIHKEQLLEKGKYLSCWLTEYLGTNVKKSSNAREIFC